MMNRLLSKTILNRNSIKISISKSFSTTVDKSSTSLKIIQSFGNNDEGQLGFGEYSAITKSTKKTDDSIFFNFDQSTQIQNKSRFLNDSQRKVEKIFAGFNYAGIISTEPTELDEKTEKPGLLNWFRKKITTTKNMNEEEIKQTQSRESKMQQQQQEELPSIFKQTTQHKKEIEKKAIKTKLWMFGSNAEMTIGIDTDEETVLVPQEVDLKLIEDDGKIAIPKQIVCSFFHTAALSEDGFVFTWGNNRFGQLGNGSDLLNTCSPFHVNQLTNIKEISTGIFHTMAINNEGEVFGFGLAENGQLGDSNGEKFFSEPLIIDDFEGIPINKISCGMFHSSFLSNDGKLFTSGSGEISYESNLSITDVYAFNSSNSEQKVVRNVNYENILKSTSTLKVSNLFSGENWTIAPLEDKSINANVGLLFWNANDLKVNKIDFEKPISKISTFGRRCMGISKDGSFIWNFDTKKQTQTWLNSPQGFKFVDIVVGWDFYFVTIEKMH